jgi:hypothetical protein
MTGEFTVGTRSALAAMNVADGVRVRLTRREMVARLLASIGAGVALPLVAESHPIHELLRNDAALDEAEKLDAADWKPTFLSPEQNESLIAIAESIVPGSTKAQANRFIDLLLSVDTSEHKKKFLDSLLTFEAESQRRFASGFPSLEPGRKNMVLADASKGAPKDASTGGARKESLRLHEHFENLKGWISGAYYSSEMGMRELGWTPDRVFASFPGCEHPEGHH